MKTIIAGSRTILRISILEAAMEKVPFTPSVIISGCAKGVDSLGEAWALARGIPIEKFPADWERFGGGAGFIRNKQMAENADALIAIWDGTSRGTKHMLKCAESYGLRVIIYTLHDGVIKI